MNGDSASFDLLYLYGGAYTLTAPTGLIRSFGITANNLLSEGADSPQFAVNSITISDTAAPSAIPLPAALPLYGAAMIVLGFMGWRRKKARQ